MIAITQRVGACCVAVAVVAERGVQRGEAARVAPPCERGGKAAEQREMQGGHTTLRAVFKSCGSRLGVRKRGVLADHICAGAHVSTVTVPAALTQCIDTYNTYVHYIYTYTYIYTYVHIYMYISAPISAAIELANCCLPGSARSLAACRLCQNLYRLAHQDDGNGDGDGGDDDDDDNRSNINLVMLLMQLRLRDTGFVLET